MATDPFADIQRPVCGEFIEIGQPTFAELIWAELCRTSPAIGRSAPNVSASLRRLAFGKTCRDNLAPPMPETPVFSAAPPPGSQPAVFSYSVKEKNPNKSRKQQAGLLKSAKTAVEFNNLIANHLGDAVLFNDPGDCAMISGGNAPPIAPGNCPDSECKVDVVWSIDNSGSMGNEIQNVINGVAGLADLINQVAEGSYRLSLQTFGQGTNGGNLRTLLPLTPQACGNLTTFQSAANQMTASGGFEPWHQALESIAYNWSTEWTFREDSDARVLFVVTDEAPGEFDDNAALTAADEMGRCNCRFVMIWTDGTNPYLRAYPGYSSLGELFDELADRTDGFWVHSPNGVDMVPLMTSFILNVCAISDRNPECPGGVDQIINGRFEANINGWVDRSSPTLGRDILWDSATQSMELSGAASQKVSGLTPGDLAILSFDVWTNVVASASKATVTAKQVSEDPSHNASFALHDPVTPFIINPDQDPETGFPAVCQLTLTSGAGTSVCTGTLIADKYVLTAAHCVDGVPQTNAVADFNGTTYNSVRITSHPLWNASAIATGNYNEAYDIAVIELDAVVTGVTPMGISSTKTPPAAMQPVGPEPGLTDPVKIVGFGLTGDDAGEQAGTTGTKRSGDQQIDLIESRLLWYDFDVAGESSAAPGDSGGPVLFLDGGTYYISGVVSGGVTPAPNPPVAELGTSVFNTRASAFDQFIFDVIEPPGPVSNILRYEMRDGSDNVLRQGTVTDAQLQPPGQDNAKRFDLFTTIGLDGCIEVFFTAEDGDEGPFYIDNVLLCVLKEDDCGSGTRNLIQNPNFENGVDFWLDENDIPISPPTDPEVWDDLINAIIVSLPGEREVRTIVNDLRPGRTYTVNFELASFEPEQVGSLEFIYRVLDSSNNILGQGNVLRQDTNPPERFGINFTAPTDGIAKVSFTGGAISGVAKVRNVLLCDTSGECEENFSRISFDEFETGKGAWSGGTFDPIEQWVLIDDADSGDVLQQTFTALQPGATLQITLNTLSGPDGTGRFLIEMTSDSVTDQFNTDGLPGFKSFETTVQASGTVVIRISSLSTFAAPVDDILICQRDAPPCDGSVSMVQALVEWDGTIRQPVNLFNAIVRYTIRDPNDPFDVTEMTFLPTAEGRLSISACDLWKSQSGTGSVLGNGLSNIGEIDNGDFSSVASKQDWIWSIPQNNGSPVQDSFIINFPDPGAGMLIENVEVFLLINNAIPAIGTNTPPVYPPPICEPDPASDLRITLRWTNSQGLQREFTNVLEKDSFWVQEADFSVGNPWDTDTATGNGIKGSSARWESTDFPLDTVDGRGLDQCTAPFIFSATATGDLLFGEFFLSGTGTFVDPCLSEVIIEDISQGDAINEIQSIILPNPTSGTWDLTFTRLGVTSTTTLPWNATAELIQIRLRSMASIGGTPARPNALVTGAGTQSDPFLVEFTNDLGAIDVPLLEADGTNLGGSASAFVTTDRDGTPNERKTISNPTDGRQDLIVTFAGDTSIPIPYNSSLDTVQAALEGMGSIGTGNIQVTGNTTDREANYAGPYFLEFIGSLGNQNVPPMTVEPAHYEVVTDWNGGPAGGQNERQFLNVNATGGQFAIVVYDPSDDSPTTTAVVDYNATAQEIKTALEGASFINVDDVRVQMETRDDVNGVYIWRVDFRNGLARTDMQQMMIDDRGLIGSAIKIDEVTKGDGSSDLQRVTVIRASGGSFRLSVVIDNVEHTTTAIPWNTTAEGLQAQLTALPPFEVGDVTVTDLPLTNAEQNLRVRVVFAQKFGGIPLMTADFQQTLLCNPVVLPPVPPGPYEYPIPECDEVQDLGCSDGPLLCRPGPGEDVMEEDPCCDADSIPDRANVSTRIKLERDLFDPNRPKRTIRDLVVIKGLDPTRFTPYMRSFRTGQLTETSYELTVETKMSILLVENELDTPSGRQRIMNQISNSREILPARFTWPECDVRASLPSVCWPEA